MCELHGHRGARGLAPENTLGGFARAISLGVAAIECDVGLTADDVVVVSHDPALNPDLTRSDGRWLNRPDILIRNLNYAELAQYDVGRARPGSATALEFPDQIPQDGARIPSLAEVLALTPRVRIDVELKTFPHRPDLTAPPEQLAAAVVDVAIADLERVTVMSFDWRGLRWLRRHHPAIRLGWLTDAEDAHSGPRAVASEGGPIWAPEYLTLTRSALDEAHGFGLRVIPWTVNQPADMAPLSGWGVDGLITDRPDLFVPGLITRSSENSR